VKVWGRLGAVGPTALVALAAVAIAFGATLAVPRPSDSSLSLTAGTGFVITSNIYPSPGCSGSTPLLFPGVTDCAIFRVQNNLSVPISVQNLAMAVNSVPVGCPASDFSLPTFGGTLTVPAGGTASTSGLPISLIDTGTNQDGCQDVTVGFTYSGNAQYTDTTSTALTSSPAAPTSGQPVTLSATVTGSNASADPTLPAGSVAFNSCPTSACSSTSPLGTGTLGVGVVATLSTSSFTTGVHYVQAVYGGEGTDYGGSTSPVLTVTVGGPVTSAATTGSGTSGGPTKPTTASAIAFTGADIAGMVAVGFVMIGAGTLATLRVRRRHRTAEPEA